MDKTIMKILGEIPRKHYDECLEDILARFKLRNPESDHHTRVFARENDVKSMLVSIARTLYQQDFLEDRLSKEGLASEEGDLIRYALAREIFPRLQEGIARLLNKEQYGYLYYEEKATHELYMMKEKIPNKITDVKKGIKNHDMLLCIKTQEVEEYEIKNAKELAEKLTYTFGSPNNRDILTKSGDLWLLAKNPDKAESYYLKAGPWEFEHAARNFENAGDSERARKFWILAAKNPTGYSDEMDYKAGRNWEKVGNIEEAIKSYEQAIQIYKWQEGSYDLHGDPKPGRAEAESLTERVVKLREILASGKTPERDKRRESIEDTFTFPIV